MITLRLPFPPSTNNLYVTRNGKRCLSERAKFYHERVVWLCRSQLGPPEPMPGRISLRLFLRPPDLRRRDISNTVKIVEDSLTYAGVWNDDSQIDHLEVLRLKVVKPGHVEVWVSQLIDKPTARTRIPGQ